MVKKDKNLSNKKSGKRSYIAVFSAILVLIIVLGLVFAGVFVKPQTKFPLTAAIVDQLGQDFPDPSFVGNVTNILHNHGFNVTYYGGPIDVDFYRKLGTYNYGIIILRAHSALRNDNSTVDLFTSEKYVLGMYDQETAQELKDAELGIGEFYYKPGEQYFVVTSKFITDVMQGGFSNSIVIAMGCQSLKFGCEQLAQAFVSKGAKAYVGWSDIILPQDTDTQTTNLVSMLLDENLTLGYAVVGTSPCRYSGPWYANSTQIVDVTSEMRFYPQTEQDLTVSELIKEAQTNPSTGAFTALGGLIACSATKLPIRRKIRFNKRENASFRNALKAFL